MFRLSGLALLSCGLLLSGTSGATNGLNLTGYGAESSAMGGADAPLSRDTFAVNLNPAGLAQISGKAFDGYVTAFNSPYNSHTDSNGAYRKPVDKAVYYGAYGGLGYAQRLADSQVTAGVGLIVQGGSGWSYKHLRTTFNTSDEISGLFGISKLALALGWNATEQWRLGAGVGLSYASGGQSVFPDTSVLNTFYGMRLKDVTGYGLNAKFGVQYQLNPEIILGAYYGTRTNLPLKGGTLRVNYSANPLIGTVVRYDHAELQGLVLPQEFAAGIAFHPTPKLLLSVQDKWYDWSAAIRNMTLVASSPRSDVAPPRVYLPSAVNFRDQNVISVGGAYDYDEKTVLRAGINYCNRVIPDANLSPVFAIIQTRHWAAGFERTLDPEWKLSATGELYPRKKVTYTNLNGPFGSNATETNGGYILSVMASRRW